MDDEQNKYRAAVKEQEKELAELSKASPSDLRDEISIARFLLRRAVAEKSPAAHALLTVISKLSQVDLQNRLRSRELWERDEVYRFAERVCNTVMEEVQGLDGYEEIIDRIAERIQNLQTEHTENE